MREKFMKADYPSRFINSVINEFHRGKDYGDESFITIKFVWNCRNFHIH